jgi:hypothetical protein
MQKTALLQRYGLKSAKHIAMDSLRTYIFVNEFIVYLLMKTEK